MRMSEEGRRGWEKKRPLPCFNVVPLCISCRLAVGACRALTKHMEIRLLVCFTFSSFLHLVRKSLFVAIEDIIQMINLEDVCKIVFLLSDVVSK